jgi:hypothetical protein
MYSLPDPQNEQNHTSTQSGKYGTLGLEENERKERQMSFAVEQHARARVVTGTADEERSAVPVDLRYDPQAAPRSVCLSFPESPGSAPHDWVFARDLLERGLRGPASTSNGDVRIWPSGRVRAVVELHSAEGVALVQFDSAALTRFLRRTYAATTPAGR